MRCNEMEANAIRGEAIRQTDGRIEVCLTPDPPSRRRSTPSPCPGMSTPGMREGLGVGVAPSARKAAAPTARPRHRTRRPSCDTLAARSPPLHPAATTNALIANPRHTARAEQCLGKGACAYAHVSSVRIGA
ncbi:hypothetical protein GCM10017674_81670 [Streptomyces gardneri]|uniref:Uncharacterized protein n=1 Tax=Streptomyces gardneri TaxID=66892 RepID=A0A4Y3RYB0_9ACTN|nr:hypothetical protein SGA01_79690 [Streptomyces gardneri]GHH24331.1 hypothetical protein GCM10017674_81670 [Streptomyces gardneri]